MDSILKYSGVVALVILAIMVVSGLVKGSAHLAGSTSCSGITCLAGGLRLVTDLGGDFESDVAAVFASTVNVTGLSTLASLTVSGASTLTGAVTTNAVSLGTLTATGTITQSAASNAATTSFKGGCIQTTATSTLTPIRLVIGSSGATTSYQGASAVGVVGWQYGTCPA